MAFGPAFDAAMDPTREGLVLTFVLPADRCNLNCPTCIIRQRREVELRALEKDDYVRFFREIAEAVPVTRIGIQGYEPLLPESWPYARAILAMAKERSIPAGLVTNGVRLEGHIEALRSLRPKRVVVSLDAPTAQEHDRRRGRAGAFEATLNGLRTAVRCGELAPRLSVASVLFPRSGEMLADMPKLLAEIGVRSWSVTPMIRIGSRTRPGGFVDGPEAIVREVHGLSVAASRRGVSLYVDDEFGFLGDSNELRAIARYRSIARADMLLRLDPAGRISIGRDLLCTVDASNPVWIPREERPMDFLQRVAPRLGSLALIAA